LLCKLTLVSNYNNNKHIYKTRHDKLWCPKVTWMGDHQGRHDLG